LRLKVAGATEVASLRHDLETLAPSSFHFCSSMYCSIISSVTAPAVAQKYPRAHMCCPQYRRLSSSYSICSFRDQRPFRYCTSLHGASDGDSHKF